MWLWVVFFFFENFFCKSKIKYFFKPKSVDELEAGTLLLEHQPKDLLRL